VHLHLVDGADVYLEFSSETAERGLDALLGEGRDELKREWIEATLGERRIVVQRSAVLWFLVDAKPHVGAII
jgi:hypothetical protein